MRRGYTSTEHVDDEPPSTALLADIAAERVTRHGPGGQFGEVTH